MIGQTVSHYKILEKLGSGGMGEVFLAEDTSLRRRVALKFLPPDKQQSETAHNRFLHEARSAATLEHANICTIHEVGAIGDKDFIVMEYVDGQTLQKRLAESPLPVADALQIALEVAEAIEEAHDKGIIHRDLKPANIMLTRKGRAKVMDFGLAKHLIYPDQVDSKAETLTITNYEDTPGGTLAYMSPEQLRGESVDFRSDIFSLGVVFYEILTRLHPFRASTAIVTSDRILHEAPVPVGKLNPEVPADIERLIQRMLAKDPAERPAGMREIIDGLRAALPPAYAAWHEPGGALQLLRRRWKLILAVCGIGLLLLAAGFFVLRPTVRKDIAGSVPARMHLAVLPFTAINATGEAAAFSRGLTETLNARLTRVTERHSLQVVPASDIRAQDIRTPDQARRELGVNLVLEGSFQWAGDMLRVTYVLLDMITHRQLRADTITAAAADPFAIEDMVVASVLNNLDVELRPAEKNALAARGTQQPSAYDYYLRARGYLQEYQKPESIRSAIDVLQRALELDPKYGLAYAGLGEAQWLQYKQTRDAKWVEEALASCRRAVVLDADLAGGHSCLGTVFTGTGQYEQSVREFQRAVALDPTSDDAHRGLASAYEKLGMLSDAERTFRRAIDLRPQYWAGYNWLGAFYAGQGRYGEAGRQFVQVTKLAPDSFVGFANLGGIYLLDGRYAEATLMLERSVALRPTSQAYSNLGTACFFQRKFDEAARAYQGATELDPKEWLLWGNLGDAYHMTSDKRDRAAEAYRQGLALGELQLKVNPRDVTLLGYMAYYHAMLGEKEKARECSRQALALNPGNPELLFNLGLACSQMGETVQALDYLKRALAAGYSRPTVRDTPLLDGLRAKSEFQKLLRLFP